ncbi:hypothetical protein [Marinovum sp.]|uniref:hypothetical protein n=1 Tax=Marinovum sp. TaxID=2024839 RepID=UPI003A8FAAF3
MSYTYAFDETERLFLLRLQGRVTASGMAEMMTALAEEPRRRPDQDVFCDLSGLESLDLSFTQVMSTTRSRASFYEQSTAARVAVWAPGDVAFGMARMYLTMLQGYDGITADVFRQRADAAAHLGRGEDQLHIP